MRLYHSVFCDAAGIMQGFAAFGPAMGYICGGLFLNIYVDVLKIDTE